MSIKEAANKLAAAWAAKKFRNEAESRKSPEARDLRLALVEAGLTHRAIRIAAAVLRARGLTSSAYTA